MNREKEEFLKITDAGDIFYHDIVELHVDDDLNVEKSTTRQIFICPSCGQGSDERNIRTSCPICDGGICCNFCHNEKIKCQKIYFDQSIVYLKQRQSLLESKLFDRLPLINFIRMIFAINMKNRLEEIAGRK